MGGELSKAPSDEAAAPSSPAVNGPKDLTLTAKAELKAYSHTSRHDCWAIANIKAPLYEQASRVPIDAVAVIDVSGSMAGAKIDLVRKTLLFVVTQLKECDRFSLVTYDERAYVKFGLLNMTTKNKNTSNEIIKDIRTGTSTNLCAGLLKGMEEISLNSGPEKAKVQSVLLFTDGLATDGIKHKEGIVAEMMKIQNVEKGYDGTVYTFGFGSDHDAAMLEAISTQGRGVYYFIDTTEKIPESFADCLGGLISVVGQNLSLKLEMQGDNEFNEVHANRTVNWITPKKSCDIALGDIQSEEGRDIVLTLVLPALAAPLEDCIFRATLSYFNVINSIMETVSCQLVVSRTGADPGTPDTAVDEQRNRISATSAMKRAQTMADQGNLEGARSLLKETIEQIECSVSSQLDVSKGLITDMKKCLVSLASQEQYTSQGQRYMCSTTQSHACQRSNYVEDDDESEGRYTNASKSAIKKASKAAAFFSK